MQFARPKCQGPAKRIVAAIASMPLTALLAAASIAITLVVAIGTVSAGRVPPSGPLGLICAVVLAAVAAVEASRPARRERVQRRVERVPAPGSMLSVALRDEPR